jgi:hypothetical protein
VQDGLIKTHPATRKKFFFPVVHNLPGTMSCRQHALMARYQLTSRLSAVV